MDVHLVNYSCLGLLMILFVYIAEIPINRLEIFSLNKSFNYHCLKYKIIFRKANKMWKDILFTYEIKHGVSISWSTKHFVFRYVRFHYTKFHNPYTTCKSDMQWFIIKVHIYLLMPFTAYRSNAIIDYLCFWWYYSPLGLGSYIC